MYRVLIIDDEKMILDMLRQALSLSGYNVETASEGQEGLQMFENGMFDLVITDILMPGIDGHGVAQYIRNSGRPQTPIIAMSWGTLNLSFVHTSTQISAHGSAHAKIAIGLGNPINHFSKSSYHWVKYSCE